jgi:hypothetical protein
MTISLCRTLALAALASALACTKSSPQDGSPTGGGGGGGGPISISIDPAGPVSVALGGARDFTATVLGTTDVGVLWSVQEGSPAGGTITAGHYVAPGTAGRYHVLAKAHADPSVVATVTVEAVAPVAGKESWIWPYNSPLGWSAQAALMASHAGSFTHLSPTFYTLNYTNSGGTAWVAYASGVAYYTTCPQSGLGYGCNTNGTDDFGTFSGLPANSSSFNGQKITAAKFTEWAHSLGFKVMPAIYAGSANGGTDLGAAAILCGGSTAAGGSVVPLSSACAAQKAFVGAMVGEAVAKKYDGYNIDWELGHGGSGDATPPTGAAYAQAFSNFMTNFKAALTAAGVGTALGNATLSVDAIASNVNGTWCSGIDGWIDYGILENNPDVDRVIIEAYNTNFQTAGWTVPSACASPLENSYGSAVLDEASPASCDYSFSGLLIMECPPNLGATQAAAFGKAVIGFMPGVNGNNPVAGQAMAAAQSYGFTKIAFWPQYDDYTHQFMSTKGIVPSTADWYVFAADFLVH